MHFRKWDAYRVYLIMSGATSLFFGMIFTVNLVYQAQVVGLTPLQLVLVGTTLETVAFLFEIPTGVVADLYSRRLSVIIGFFLIGVGFAIEGALPFFWAVLLNQVIWGIGVTFTSGALEAWIVDEVGEERMGKVLLRGAQAGQVGGIIGIVVSVALGSIALALPVLVGGLLYIGLAAFMVVVMPETGFKPRQGHTTWGSMAHTVREGVRLVRLRPILLTFLGISLVLGMYSEGFDRLWRAHLLDNFTLPPLGALNPVVWFGIINVVSMLLSTATTEIVRRRLNTNNQRAIARMLIVSFSLMVAALLVFALVGNVWIALVALWVANTMRGTAEPVVSTWTNLHVDSSVRATMLSSIGQLNAVGQIAGGPVVGVIGDTLGLRAALSTSALLLSPVVWLIARVSKREPTAQPEPIIQAAD